MNNFHNTNTNTDNTNNIQDNISTTFSNIIYDIAENKQYKILDVFWKDNRPIHIGSFFLIISGISALYYIYRKSLMPSTTE